MEQYVYTYDSFAQRGAEQYVPTERFQVKSSVYLPASDIDLRTGRLQPDRQRRRRTQALMLEKERLDAEDQTLSESLRREYSKSGVRISVRALVLIVAAVLFFCGILLLSQQGMIAERRRPSTVWNAPSRIIVPNASLEEEIAQASDASTICYAAARDLNMIPAEAAEAVYLVAVDTRPAAVTASAETEESVNTSEANEADVPAGTIHVSADSGN